MNNLENYQADLAEYLVFGKLFAVNEDGTIMECIAFNLNCGHCIFKNVPEGFPEGCIEARRKWLTEEYAN